MQNNVVKSSMQQDHTREEYTTAVCGANYKLLAFMLLKYPDGQLLFAVDPCQLLTMASETLDLIYWPLPGRPHHL